MTGTLHEDVFTFLIISRSFLLRMRNVSDKICSKNQNTLFTFSNFFFRKSSRSWQNVEKYFRAGQATDGNMAHAHCMLDTYGYKHTLRVCITYCFSTAQCLYERTLMLRYMYIPVLLGFKSSDGITIHMTSFPTSDWKLNTPLTVKRRIQNTAVFQKPLPPLKCKVFPLQARCGPEGG